MYLFINLITRSSIKIFKIPYIDNIRKINFLTKIFLIKGMNAAKTYQEICGVDKNHDVVNQLPESNLRISTLQLF